MKYRIAKGVMNGSRTISFTFDGRPLTGIEGDTVAAALLANGVRLVGRSFKYHRPRGIMSSGPEEANALVTVTLEGRREPNARATEITLADGMTVESQNNWPSLRHDIGAVNQLAGKALSAGFYYKTFMAGGLKGWMWFEHFIRKAAGLGRVDKDHDPARYDAMTLFCDHLVVGGGLAGLLAARDAADTDARVIWADQGLLNPARMAGQAVIDGQQGAEWCAAQIAALRAAENVQILEQTSVAGLYDQNVVAAVRRPENGPAFEVFYEIEPHQITLATGAIERPIAFPGNDRPGVMLASAGWDYLRDFGVAVGRKPVGFTNNDSLYHGAFAMARAGLKLTAIVDLRAEPDPALLDRAQALGIQVHTGHEITSVTGRHGVTGIEAGPVGSGTRFRIPCDALLVSGGWNPAVHLWSQAGGKLRFDDMLQAFVPSGEREGITMTGAAAGQFDPSTLSAAITQTHGLGPVPPLFAVKANGKAFVDFQNDVTVSDISQSAAEGYQSVEHLKRYTTLGMGTDQGKTSNVVALALMAETLGSSPGDVGTTKFRPPYKPLSMGALAGPEVGLDMFPTRRTPLHHWHIAHGAHMQESGDWYRSAAYAQESETVRQAAIREAAHVRVHAGIVDVSTLGKIIVEGPDALEFLNRICVNALTTLKTDRSRYYVMLREDGMVLDDGTVCRLGENRFLVTTTTGNAGNVFRLFDRYLQVDWPDLLVATTSLTDHYCAIALAGPESRSILEKLLPDADVSNTSLPFMAHATHEWQGFKLELFRVSFSGELAYELFAPSGAGIALWQKLYDLGAKPYGVKALDILRIEKGHLTGAEIDGRRCLEDLGMGRLARPDRHFVGKVMAQRPDLRHDGRLQLVGLRSVDPSQALEEGMHLVPQGYSGGAEISQGHVTSACFSPTHGSEIALAVLQAGRTRHGQRLVASAPMKDRHIEVEVTLPIFVDPEGERLHG